MKRPTDAELAQACTLAEEIAAAACRADMSCFQFNPPAGRVENYQLQIDILRDMVKRMGWLADLCVTKLGGCEIQGDAEAWMTSPVYLSHGRGDA